MGMKSYGIEPENPPGTVQVLTTPKAVSKLDPEDFWEFIKPFKEKLYNFIIKALNFSEDGEDIYQETVLKAYKNMSGFKKKSSLKTWFFSIANNEIRQYYKKKKRDETYKTNFSTSNAFEISGPKKNILVESIYEIAQKFSLKYKQVFFLFYYNRFSIEEINEITGVKKGSVKYILNSCRERVKKELGGEDGS